MSDQDVQNPSIYLFIYFVLPALNAELWQDSEMEGPEQWKAPSRPTSMLFFFFIFFFSFLAYRKPYGEAMGRALMA